MVILKMVDGSTSMLAPVRESSLLKNFTCHMDDQALESTTCILETLAVAISPQNVQ